MRKLSGLFLAVILGLQLDAQTQVCCVIQPTSGGGGTGTVTSVAATVPAYMTVSGSPITTAGTIAFDFGSQSANLFFASPNGSSGVPLFRALVAADLPATISSNTTGNAATATTATSATTASTATTAATATALATNPTDCPGGQFANAIDAGGNLTCGTPSGGASLPVVDTTSVVEGSADATKEVRLEVDGLTTGTTRVLTVPDANITIAGTNLAQSWTAQQTYTVAPTAPVSHSTNQQFGTVTTPLNPTNLTAFGSGIACGIAGAGGVASSTVAFGDGITCSNIRRNTIIGSGGFSNAHDCTRLGYLGGCTGAGSIAIGSGSTVTGTNSMLFLSGGNGGGSTNNVANSVAFWGTDNAITLFRIGKGHTDAAPVALTIQGTSGSGTNVAGARVNLAAGASTGTGAGGAVALQTSPSGASGSTLGTLVDRVLVPAKAVALTSGSATTVFDVSLPALGFAGETFSYTIFASDGTDVQSLSGTLNVAAVNKGGTITSTITSSSGGAADDTTAAKAVSAGTLTATWSVVAGAGAVSVRVTPTTSLTATSFGVYYQILNNSPQTITPF